MKKRLLSLIIVAIIMASLSGPVFGQAHNASVWVNAPSQGTAQLIPWYTYTGKDLAFDIRHNFDAEDTFAAFAGTPVSAGDFTIVPSAGALVGNYEGISAQINLFGGGENFSVFSMNQYSKGLSGSSDFFYHWTEILYSANSWLSIGIGEEVFSSFSGDPLVNVGPSVRIDMPAGTHLKVWPVVSPTHPESPGSPTLYSGLGVTF